MQQEHTRKSRKDETWPRKVTFGRETVKIYRRITASGNFGYMVSNYAGKKRRFDSYPTETEAIQEANKLAKQLSQRDVIGASMTKGQAIDFAAAVQALEPLNLSLAPAVATLVQAVKLVGDLPSVIAASKYYAARHKRTVAKPVKEAVAEFLAIKESRGAGARYMQDLRYRLNRFAEDCKSDVCNITTADIQQWFDGENLSPQNYTNYRRVLHIFFEFAVARNYAADNPVKSAERVKVRGGEIEIFTPKEIARLLLAASPDFRPCLAIGAFAGLRSAEIERLEWSDIDLSGGFITVGASKAKTASRRIVSIQPNLAEWLAPYAGKQGKIWTGLHDEFYDAQQETAAATNVKADEKNGIKEQPAVNWKKNALRHSYASYRFAQIGDAGRVAGELGNSAAVVHKHYRELVKPADAEKWFAVKPEAAAGNIISMRAKA